jgi:hypothetical protein
MKGSMERPRIRERYRHPLDHVNACKTDKNISGAIAKYYRSNKKDMVYTLLTLSFDTEALIPFHTEIFDPAQQTTLLLVIIMEYNTRRTRGEHDLDFTIKVVTALLEKGANVNIQRENGRTPLSYAITAKSVELMTHLMSVPNCDVNLQDNRKDTPLHYAVDFQFIPGIRLVAHDPRCNINLQNRRDKTPLMEATRLCIFEAQTILLESGGLHLCDYSGQTPLHIAVSDISLETVQLLLKHGASLEIRDRDGKTPIDLFSDVFTRIRTFDPTSLDFMQKRLMQIVSVIETEAERRALRALFPIKRHIKQSENRLCSVLCLLDDTL